MKQFPESNSFLSRGENIFSDAKWFKDGRIFTRTAEAFYIWDVNGYLIRKVDKIAGDSIRGTAFLSDDRFVSWENGNENELYLWSSGGDKILEVKGFSGSVDEIIITPDDRIISTHYDSMLRIWDSSGNLLNTSKTPNPSLDEFTLTPTGQIITCGGNIIRIYNSDGEKLLDYTGHKKSALRARQRHDGSYVSWSYYEKAAHIWNSKGDLLNKIKLGYSLDEIRIREDDSMISWGEYSGHLDLWNADGSKQAGLKEHGRTIMRKVILLKDGMFLSIDRDSTICLWQNNNVLWENSEEDGWDKWVTDFQVTDDAVPLILSALDSGVIRFTDLVTGKSIYNIYHGASDYGGPIVYQNNKNEFLVRASHVCKYNSEGRRQLYFGSYSKENKPVDAQFELSIMLFDENRFIKGLAYNRNSAISWEYNSETKKNSPRKLKAEADVLKAAKLLESSLKRLHNKKVKQLELYITVRSQWGVEIITQLNPETLRNIKGMQFLSSEVFTSLQPVLPEIELSLLQFSFLSNKGPLNPFYGILAKRVLFYHCNNLTSISGSSCFIESINIFGTKNVDHIDVSNPMGECKVEFVMDENSYSYNRKKVLDLQ